MTVSKEYAVSVDTEIVKLENKQWLAQAKLRQVRDNIINEAYGWSHPIARQKHYSAQNIQDALEISKASDDQYKVNSALANQTKSQALSDTLVEINISISSLQKVWQERRWSRAFLVVNANGHVHKERSCSTCYETTLFSWRVEYSGSNEIEIVEDAGEMACTVCYPSAPAEFLNKPTKIITEEQQAKAIRQAEAKVKSDAKKAKAKIASATLSGEILRLPTGRKYRDFDQYLEIKTERTAVSQYYDNLYTLKQEAEHSARTVRYDGTPLTQNEIIEQGIWSNERIQWATIQNEIIEASLAEKHGVTVVEQIEILRKKYAKRASN